MSEYVTVEVRPTNAPDVLEIVTNQTLTADEREVYDTREAGDEGSTLAQTLFGAVDDIAALTITPHTLIVQRAPDAVWEALVDDIRDVLRDFFL